MPHRACIHVAPCNRVASSARHCVCDASIWTTHTTHLGMAQLGIPLRRADRAAVARGLRSVISGPIHGVGFAAGAVNSSGRFDFDVVFDETQRVEAEGRVGFSLELRSWAPVHVCAMLLHQIFRRVDGVVKHDDKIRVRDGLHRLSSLHLSDNLQGNDRAIESR